MSVQNKNESVPKIVQNDEENHSESLGSEDSFSDRSLESENDCYEEDGFIIIEKQDQEISFDKNKKWIFKKKEEYQKWML